MQIHVHPRSGAIIEGVRLPHGGVIRQDDRYDSSDGRWRTCSHVVGNAIQPGCTTVWVRQTPLSDNARTLLGYLNLKPWGEKTCIGERRGNYYVIPSPTFNWDGGFDIEAKRVVYPECVQELVDHGYLAFGEHEARNWMSDYSTVWDGHENRVYTLTDEGMREGA